MLTVYFPWLGFSAGSEAARRSKRLKPRAGGGGGSIQSDEPSVYLRYEISDRSALHSAVGSQAGSSYAQRCLHGEGGIERERE